MSEVLQKTQARLLVVLAYSPRFDMAQQLLGYLCLLLAQPPAILATTLAEYIYLADII